MKGNLKEKDNILHNIFNERLDNTKELEDSYDLPSIKSLVKQKINEYIEYCESKGVYYFSDLPISSDINEFMFESISSCINFKKQLKKLENEIYNLKFVIPFITKGTYKKKALDKAGAYLTKYNFIDGMSFQDIYKMFYISYYQNPAIYGELTIEAVNDVIYKNEILAKKLGTLKEHQEVIQAVSDLVYKMIGDKQLIYK